MFDWAFKLFTPNTWVLFFFVGFFGLTLLFFWCLWTIAVSLRRISRATSALALHFDPDAQIEEPARIRRPTDWMGRDPNGVVGPSEDIDGDLMDHDATEENR